MSSKDLSSKSELFMKLALKRLGQDPLAGGAPLFHPPGSKSKDNASLEEVQNKLFGPSPSKPTGTHNVQPQGAKPIAPAAAAPGLPGPAAALLAPYKGKGLLNVVQEGKNLKIIYNARGMSDTGLQKKLQDALPGYTVSVLGQTQFPPQMANY